jgi:hypothetical protein
MNNTFHLKGRETCSSEIQHTEQIKRISISKEEIDTSMKPYELRVIDC